MRLLESLINIIAPHDCLSCGVEGSLLCAGCRVTSIQPTVSSCYRCHGLTPRHSTCLPCRQMTPLRSVWVVAEHQDSPKQLIEALKFGRAAAAATVVGEIMDEVIPPTPGVVVVPIPTATARVRQRGYDQATLVSRAFARRRGLAYLPVIVRYGQTRQVGASRVQRLQQLRSAYGVPDPRRIQGRDVLLVDDVLTTGATVENAARVLIQCGARSVSAVVFTQKSSDKLA